MSLLFIDVGNTFAKCVEFSKSTCKYKNFRIYKDVNKLVEDFIMWLTGERIVSEIIMSSTVPKSYLEVEAVAKKYKINFHKMNYKMIHQIIPTFSVAYDVNKLGSDRLIAAAGAYLDSDHFEATIVVDAGTAVNIEVIVQSKGYIGGSILPGFRLMRQALFRGTAQLPCITHDETSAPNPVGTCTLECISSGVYSAVCGGVYDVVFRTSQQGSLKDLSNIHLIFTGGDCDVLSNHLKKLIETNMPNVKSVSTDSMFVMRSMCKIFTHKPCSS